MPDYKDDEIKASFEDGKFHYEDPFLKVTASMKSHLEKDNKELLFRLMLSDVIITVAMLDDDAGHVFDQIMQMKRQVVCEAMRLLEGIVEGESEVEEEGIENMAVSPDDIPKGVSRGDVSGEEEPNRGHFFRGLSMN